MPKFIIVEILEPECFNDPKAQVYLNSDGDIIEFDSVEEAKQDAVQSEIPNFEVYERVWKSSLK